MSNYNNPIDAVQQVNYNVSTFKSGFYRQLVESRKKLLIALSGLTIAVIATQGLLLHLLKDDLIQYRPPATSLLYFAYCFMAITLQDELRKRAEFDIGWRNIQQVGVEAYEDLIQQQAHRSYIPYDHHLNPMEFYEQNRAMDVPPADFTHPPEPLSLPSEVKYAEPPILQKSDLSDKLATATLPTMLVGSTGTGKTTLLMNVIGQLVAEHKKVIVFDCKPKPGSYDKFGDAITYIPFKHYRETPMFVQKLQQVSDEIMEGSRDESSEPIHVIIDEINNGITKADLYTKESNDTKSKYPDRLSMYSQLIISQGRQLNVPSIATTHDPTGAALGISAQMRNNYRFAILASPVSQENVETILSNTVKLITDDDKREALKKEYQGRKAQGQFKDKYFALSNVGGDWRFTN